jgi:hypothetical protein
MAIVQALKEPGEIHLEAISAGLAGASATIQAVKAEARPAVA